MALIQPLSDALHAQYVDLRAVAADVAEAGAMADLMYDFYSAAKDLETEVRELQVPTDDCKEQCLDFCYALWRGRKTVMNEQGPFNIDTLELWMFGIIAEMEDLREKHKATARLLQDMQALCDAFQQPAKPKMLAGLKDAVAP